MRTTPPGPSSRSSTENRHRPLRATPRLRVDGVREALASPVRQIRHGLRSRRAIGSVPRVDDSGRCTRMSRVQEIRATSPDGTRVRAVASGRPTRSGRRALTGPRPRCRGRQPRRGRGWVGAPARDRSDARPVRACRTNLLHAGHPCAPAGVIHSRHPPDRPATASAMPDLTLKRGPRLTHAVGQAVEAQRGPRPGKLASPGLGVDCQLPPDRRLGARRSPARRARRRRPRDG